MNPNIEKIREGLYIKKSFDGYRVVYPSRHEDGTLNWFNILTGGNWWILLKTTIIVLLILGLCWSYMEDTKTCREFINDPSVNQRLRIISSYGRPYNSNKIKWIENITIDNEVIKDGEEE